MDKNNKFIEQKHCKFKFWIIIIPVFLDLFIGGMSYILSGFYGLYMSLPILLVDGAGFTLGFSLIPLIPYFAALIYLNKIIKILGHKYKKIALTFLIIILLIYTAGVTTQIVKKVMYTNKLNQYKIQQKITEIEFNKELRIENFIIEKVPQYYKYYKTTFIIVIPSQYIGNSKGELSIKINSSDIMYDIDANIYYENGQVIENRIDAIFPDSINLTPFFDTNGDLRINVFYVCNEIDVEESKIYNIDLRLKLEPLGQYRFTKKPYYELEYTTNFDSN
ncbi:hypothetical protein HOD20_09705 [archaeon]|jgi:hypothetical protein|nr:hypothetical protein [archaeon]MBT4647848.1 hypothetical protein [archaeon]MBT6821049.1 hypothetical protein [archaeon]MBT7392032.1 hypothetical protein [archaeon]